jgi:RsiW-degrading membrane proteinase PrsW (M82 family)
VTWPTPPDPDGAQSLEPRADGEPAAVPPAPTSTQPPPAVPGQQVAPGGYPDAAAPAAVPAGPAGFPVDGSVPGPAVAGKMTSEGRRRWARVGVLGVVVAVTIVCGIVLLLLIGYPIGPVALGVGIVGAALPVPVIVSVLMWLDRYEPEPTVYLVICFLWGAFVASLVALGANNGTVAVFHAIHLSQTVVGVVTAPIVEESMKALGPALLLLITVKLGRRTFNGKIDAIVLFGMSATGFAMSENILYLGRAGYAAGVTRGGVAGGVTQVLAIFLLRVPLSGFAHPLFTSMTAIGVGAALAATSRRARRLAPVAGLLAAIALHASWNSIITIAAGTGHAEVVLYGYFSVFVPIFFGVVGYAMWLRSAEGRMTQTALLPYVQAGWLSPPEVASLASVSRRRSARAWAHRVAGPVGTNAMRGFQLTATRLALLRDRAERRASAGLDAGGVDLADERRLLDLISAYRAAYVGADVHAPAAWWDGSRYHVIFPGGENWTLPAPETPVVPLPIYAPALPVPGYPYPPPPGFR